MGAANVIATAEESNVAMMEPMLVPPNVEIPWWLIPPVLSANEPAAFRIIPPDVVPPVTETTPTVPPLIFTPVLTPELVPGELKVMRPVVVPLVMPIVPYGPALTATLDDVVPGALMVIDPMALPLTRDWLPEVPGAVVIAPLTDKPPFRVVNPPTVSVFDPPMETGAAKVMESAEGSNVAIMDAVVAGCALMEVIPAKLIPPVPEK